MKSSVLAALVVVFALIAAIVAISADWGDSQEKAASMKAKSDILHARKAALGSSAPPMMGEVQVLTINRARTRGCLSDRQEGRSIGSGRLENGSGNPDEEPDEGPDNGETCYSEGSAYANNTFYAGHDEDWYCVENICPGAIIRIDIDSHKLGAPTDVYVDVYDNCELPPIACRDDGNGFSGVSTDSCVMVTAPESGKIWWRVVNLCENVRCLDPDGGDCSYEMGVTISSITETENNDDFPGEDLMYTTEIPDGFQDEGGDEGELVCYRNEDEGFVAAMIDPDDDTDKFRICMFEGEVLQVHVEAGKCNNFCDYELFDPVMDLYYYDPEAATYDLVASADDIDGVDPGFFYTATRHGEYVIDFQEWSADGSPDNLYFLYTSIIQGYPDASDTCEGAECFELLEEVCPCNGFRNHGGYVVCMVRYAKGLRMAGEITQEEFAEMVSTAAQSNCSQPDIHSGKGDHGGWDGSSKNKDIPKP